MTRQPVPDAGLVWSALSDMHADTGLVPVVLEGEEDEEDFFFTEPQDVAQVDLVNAAQLLESLWGDPWSGPAAGDDPVWRAMHAPYFQQFPGLAPPAGVPLHMGRLHQALRSLSEARIGLVAAQRPADALPVTGWSPFGQYFITGTFDLPNPVGLAAVLRTWEPRFGAKLLRLGPGAEMQLLVERPPRHLAAAQHLAAERHAFCDECGGVGLTGVADIASALIDDPIWTFWWD